MTPQLDVSVVICAYTEHRWDDLVIAVKSVKHQTLSAHEIIVVIDHNPSLLERAQTDLPETLIVENSEPRGLSGARNSGIAVARGDIIAFLDDDAQAAPDWLEHLLASYDRPNVIGVGGKIVPVWQNGRPGWFPEEFDWVIGCTYRGHSEIAGPVRNLIGANMSIRRDAFDKVGDFRIGRIGSLSLGQENDETELCIRIGYVYPSQSIMFNPAAVVYHKVSLSRENWLYFIKRCYSEGISKARLSHTMGTERSLASERSYTLRALPLGFVRGIADALIYFDLEGLERSGAITLGLGVTVMGYGFGKAVTWLNDCSFFGKRRVIRKNMQV